MLYNGEIIHLWLSRELNLKNAFMLLCDEMRSNELRLFINFVVLQWEQNCLITELIFINLNNQRKRQDNEKRWAMAAGRDHT